MIQFNLLPDVKLEYIKATYRRRIISLICFMAAGVFLFVFILMFVFVRVNQTRHLSNLDKEISQSVKELRENNPDLDKILTIQNQLNSLPSLHDKKVMSSRIFDYLTQVTPAQASITEAEIDLEGKSMFLRGSADSVQTINKFVDTLKFTTYKLDAETPKEGKAFNSVVLKNFVINSQQAAPSEANKSISYEIVFSYDEAILQNTAKDGSPVANAVTLTVPKIITTQSETQKPTNLFQQGVKQPGSGEGN